MNKLRSPATKTIRVGVTESTMMLALKNGKSVDRHSALVRSKLVHQWNSIGFYDKCHSDLVSTAETVSWDTHVTESVIAYWDLYFRACENSDRMIHLRRSILEAEELTGEGRQVLEHLFSSLQVPPRSIEATFSYSWVNQETIGEKVIIVSPFARLMDRQVSHHHIEKLRPNFQPSDINFFEFPYCFANQGPHGSSFETIEWAVSELAPKLAPGTSILLSCGSMGVPIAARLRELGANTYYCGGAMQLFFGIMGKRWHRNPNDRALDKSDQLLDSLTTHPELWVQDIPDEFVPRNAAIVEGGCYW